IASINARKGDRLHRIQCRIVAAGSSVDGGPVTAGQDAVLDAGTTLTVTDVTTANDTVLIAGEAISYSSVDAGNDVSAGAGTSITGGAVTAGNDAALTAATSITATDVGAANDALLSAGGSIGYSSVSAGANADLDAGTSIAGGPVAAGNNATLDAGTSITTTGDVTAGNDAALTAADAISYANIDAGNDATLTAGTMVDGDAVSAGNNAAITAGTSINATDVTAGVDATVNAGTTLTAAMVSAGDDLTATSGTDMTLASAAADSDSSGAGVVALTSSSGPLQVTGASSGVSVSVDSGGTVSLGNTQSTGGDVSIQAVGDVTSGPIVSSDNIDIGSMTAPSNVTLFGTSTSGAGIDITTGGTILIGDTGQVTAGTDLNTSSGDIDIADGGLLKANDTATLTVTGGEEAVQLGDGATGDAFTLTDAEINRIEATDLVVNAGMRDIAFTGIAFDDLVGSSSAVFATTGDIDFTGSLSGAGAGRLFRFGGGPASDSADLAGTIAFDIEQGTALFAGADLELRGNRILFGSSTFLADDQNSPRNLPIEVVASTLVGQGNSILYQEQGLNAPATYLSAQNLNVIYGEAALFQNSGLFSSVVVETTGAEIGGTLTLNPTSNGPNAFALFGSLGVLSDNAAALAGPTIIIQQSEEEVQDFSSRINGCIIGSGAGCLNTIIGVTVIEISPEQLDLLTAEDEVLLPFDPLVGTNNEGLFSDVEPECERDEEGVCIQ
ncbi:MAG: hypothetical protein AAFY42_09495, partial [Pseudomonadota bacterium]